MASSPRLRTAALAALACTTLTGLAHAAETRPTLVDLKTQFSRPDALTLLTNECIAKAAGGAPREAMAACDAAVKQAEAAASAARTSQLAVYIAPEAQATLALALSNRAVVHWLNGSVAANEDIARAAALAPQASYVQANRVALAQPRAVTVAAR
jgi:Flp pilus assembly protein TadG